MGSDNDLQTLSVEHRGPVAIVTFRRGDQLNAINTVMQAEITEALSRLGTDADTRVIIVTGEGRGFMAGADIKEYAAQSDDDFAGFQARGGGMYAAIEDNPKPVIAAVNGFALGGGFELVLCCDIVVAVAEAKMGLPEIKLGLIPGGGGTQRAVRILGLNRAKYLTMTGAMLPAADFAGYGLVQETTTPEELMPRALAIAEEIASGEPEAIRHLKRLTASATVAALEDGLAAERDAVCALYRTDQAKAKVQAFAEKSAAREARGR
ncbi:enoyl-CoA hydratase/isomerase family protein [Bauldia sp.]|uniref:enoyl-CoA hydratase/isomerase family protein n=1 Tax=Bauldia sp. TaxID=2575872 RepID=UPI003BA9FB00